MVDGLDLIAEPNATVLRDGMDDADASPIRADTGCVPADLMREPTRISTTSIAISTSCAKPTAISDASSRRYVAPASIRTR